MNGHDDRGRQRPPDTPRSEPEIIPPDRGRRRGPQFQVWLWVADRDGMRRGPITIPGPFTIFLAVALVALVVTVVLAVVLGALLLWMTALCLVIGPLHVAAV